MSENLVTAAQKAVSYTVTVFLFSLSYYIIPGPFLFFFLHCLFERDYSQVWLSFTKLTGTKTFP